MTGIALNSTEFPWQRMIHPRKPRPVHPFLSFRIRARLVALLSDTSSALFDFFRPQKNQTG